jgi:hypothetical protein
MIGGRVLGEVAIVDECGPAEAMVGVVHRVSVAFPTHCWQRHASVGVSSNRRDE